MPSWHQTSSRDGEARAQTSVCSLLFGGGHATAEMLMQWRALEEYWIDNNQVDILAKQGAVIGGPPQALERAETTRRHHEIATAILEERDHPGPWVDAKS